MAELTRFLFLRHLRSEAASYVLHTRGGARVAGGRGASFWFVPWSASISELPMDEQDLVVVFAARTADFQAVTAQGVVTWRVVDPEKLAERVDFALDLDKGTWVKQPLEPIGSRLTQLSQQIGYGWLGGATLKDAIRLGVDELRTRILDGLGADPGLADLGIRVTSVRIASLRPEAEVERALQTPTREAMQQDADKATFERRAMAVERERAIGENELTTKIELAKREEQLIAQRGQNERKRVTDEAESARISAVAAADRSRIEAEAEAGRIAAVEAAKNEAEASRVAIVKDLPTPVIAGLVGRELAAHLPSIEHLTLAPDQIGPALARLASAG